MVELFVENEIRHVLFSSVMNFQAVRFANISENKLSFISVFSNFLRIMLN